MEHYQIWNHKDIIYTPSGKSFTPKEWEDLYSWCKIPGCKMVITSGFINGGVALEFIQMKEQYKNMGASITDDMSDEEVLRAIEDFENNPPITDDPTPEERIAAAMEAQVMMMEPESISTMSLNEDNIRQSNKPSVAYDRIFRNYQKGLWSSSLVALAQAKGHITQEEMESILNGQ